MSYREDNPSDGRVTVSYREDNPSDGRVTVSYRERITHLMGE